VGIWSARSLRDAADSARDRGDWREAARLYSLYLEKRPAHFAVRLRLGNMFKEMGDLEGAQAVFDAALAERPTDPAALRSRAELEMFRGSAEAALPFFAQAWHYGRDVRSGQMLTRADALAALPGLGHAVWSVLEGGVDGLRGNAIEGWLAQPDRLEGVHVLLEVDGVVRARATPDLLRPEIHALGLAPLVCGFRLTYDGLLTLAPDSRVSVRLSDAPGCLPGSPVDMTGTQGLRRWLGRSVTQISPQPRAVPSVSIMLPFHDVRHEWLEEALGSVRRQTHGNWELVCVDDGSKDPSLAQRVDAAAAADPRIKLIRSERSLGVAAASNLAMASATGDYLLFLDHDDCLEPEAVERIVNCPGRPDVMYGDEVLTGTDSADVRIAICRPAFSWWYYLSHPYFVHPVMVRRQLALSIGGFDETLRISADVDFILRALEGSSSVVHVPSVLYRWRTHRDSTGHRLAHETMAATQAALSRHVKRVGRDIRIDYGPTFNTFCPTPADSGGSVRVIIPTRNRGDLLEQCVESLADTVQSRFNLTIIDHESSEPETLALLNRLSAKAEIRPYKGAFNYSKMNNEAAASCALEDEFLLFMNNDIEALTPGWFERMRALASQPDVGAVGATLLYPDGRVQHAGVVIGMGGYAEHAYKFEPFERNGTRNPGYNCGLIAVRDWSAVTGACLMVRRAVFEAVGGFDEFLPVGFNDTDLCLRIRALGLSVLNDGFSVLRHHESATRRDTGSISHPADAMRFAEKWSHILAAGDPYYSPHLSLERPFEFDWRDGDDHVRSRAVSLSAALSR